MHEINPNSNLLGCFFVGGGMSNHTFPGGEAIAWSEVAKYLDVRLPQSTGLQNLGKIMGKLRFGVHLCDVSVEDFNSC